MASQPQNVRLLRFGVFEVDLQARELRKGGLKIKIHDQPFQVLAALLEHPGEIVTREELRQKLWPADTFVNFDQSLNTAVNKLREALGDSAESPRFIETVPRRGYRFLRPFESLGNQEVATQPAIVIASPEREGRWRWSLLALVVLILGIGGIWFYWLKRASSNVPAQKTVPLVSYLGNECCPTFSPDGNQVAFSWNGPKQDNYDIYVKLIGMENAVRLTNDPARDECPAWSPDGRYIAFLRWLSGNKVGVFLVSPIGGPDRKLAETDSVGGLSWFPDGKWLAVCDLKSLYLLSVETGEKRRLTHLPATAGSYDATPSFSPDGRYLAFSRSVSYGHSEIYLLALSDNLAPKGEPKQITFQHQLSDSPAWTANGREIIYSSGASSIPGQGLWRIPVSGGGSPQPLFMSAQVGTPAISRQGNRLAYTRGSIDINIWRLDVPGANRKATEPISLISSTYSDDSPQYSPDGKRVVFCSERSGTLEVWMCGSDGSHAVQLTSLGATITGSPRWSPDGQRIVFDSNIEGQFELYQIDANGGRPRRLTKHPANDAVASYSRDGRWVYFTSDRTGRWEIWKVPATGGQAVQVTRNGGYFAFESHDGGFVYYTKDPNTLTATLWRIPVGGGDEVEILKSVIPYGFALTNKGIYFEQPNSNESTSVQFLSFATGKVTIIASIRRPGYLGLSVSPDELYLLYTQVDQTGSDLMLVENFR
jgi:Tol biopolymer transport system component/DNA-binding winged helix-turn-helix (wHTH) protein